MSEPEPPNENEAFHIWLRAYTNNYQNTGLMKAEVLARQAWLAAINYMQQALEEQE